MDTFKIFVVGFFNAGKTSFIQSVSEIDLAVVEASEIAALGFGRLTLSSEIVLYLFVHPPGLRMERTFEYLGKRGLLLSETGFVLIMNSAYPDVDRENAHFLQYIQSFNRPYVVALSKQDLPNARTPQQMREILAIPDDIKVLSYDLKDPSSTKKVVLALLELMPQDEITQQIIEGLKAKIE